ncbi:hypothetical protein EYF80_028362 [Liparis tanakae]|uniref:Uncharacterized protein n=1 Tax=Liparis tanakae TaxID=230148 RepID=A0A4Z2H7Y2_9TELE|nr:hypothetical protein EYF80_028362 [Liparis tanakae]
MVSTTSLEHRGRLDVDIVVIDIDLGNLHLEVVGKEPDGFPHRAEAGTPRRLEQRGRRGGRACRPRGTVRRTTLHQNISNDFIVNVGSYNRSAPPSED